MDRYGTAEPYEGAPPTRIFHGPAPRRPAQQGNRAARRSPTGPSRGQKGKRRLPLKLACFAVTLLAVFVAARVIVHPAGSAADPHAQESSAQSTPRSEWRRGSLPHLYQIDPQWADEPYAGGTIRENGCGPTSLSMVYIALTGREDRDPAAMARFSEENGYVADNMTAWALMTDGAAQLGLSNEELPATVDALADALTAGHPVICSMRPGDFTTTGHFIVLVGIDENDQLIVRDPNSAARSSMRWDPERVLSQCANLWAFSVM